MSLIINPLHFDLLVPGEGAYAVNPSAIKDYAGKLRNSFKGRLGCYLRITALAPGKQRHLDAALLLCYSNTHAAAHKECRTRPLYVHRWQMNSTRGTSGNVLVPLHNKFCHGCGKLSPCCWETWNKHYVCPTCIVCGITKAPFDYGVAERGSCCKDYKCGSKINSEKNIYERAVSLFAGIRSKRVF